MRDYVRSSSSLPRTRMGLQRRFMRIIGREAGEKQHRDGNQESPSLPTATSMRPAEHSVLQMTELLENILLYLPLEDLLFADRISKYWHDLVHTSIGIQRALFLAPLPATSTVSCVNPFLPIIISDVAAHSGRCTAGMQATSVCC